MSDTQKSIRFIGVPPSGISGVGSFLSLVGYAVVAVCLLGSIVAYNDIGYAAIAFGIIGAVQGAMLLAFASMTSDLARINWILSSAAIPSKRGAVDAGYGQAETFSGDATENLDSGAF